MRKHPMVATSTWMRWAPRALPRISSARPCEYTSAVSNMFTPAWSAISMRRAASATSVAPQARYVSLLPPKVAVPILRADTRKPDPPIRRYSITDILSFALVDACAGIRADAAQVFWLVRSYLYLRSRRVMQFADRRDIAPTIAPPQNR